MLPSTPYHRPNNYHEYVVSRYAKQIRQEFRGTQDQKAYQDKIAGAQFLEFLRKRLIFLKNLLSDDGSLFLHMDWRKGHHAKVIADEVFGEACFTGEIVWKRATAHAQKQSFGIVHDIIYQYRRTTSRFIWNPQFEKHSKEHIDKYYSNRDSQGRRYALDNLTAEGSGPARVFFGRKIEPPSGTHWRYSQKQIDELSKKGLIVMTSNKRPRFKRYLDTLEGRVIGSLWMDVPAVNSQAAEDTHYPTQKPEALLHRIIQSSSQPGDLVLDAFAGSGTTCAVAERLGRRWMAIDCGKLAIYTIQKRLHTLSDVGSKSRLKLKDTKPFGLYNAGLYDFSKLRELPWDSWRFFALQLFQCQEAMHRIGGIQLDGYLKGSSVLVFNHQQQPGVRVDEETIESLHQALGSRIGARTFIVAPALVFDFQQDYLTLDDARYYALRIPYSIIHELHQREFTALKQPSDELAVNDTVDAVGFDFVRRPELEYEAGAGKRRGELFEEGFIKIKTFKSEAVVREPMRNKRNRETLSMVMLDYDFDGESDVFDVDKVFYAEVIEKSNWELRFPVESLGNQLMVVFVDIYGNEAREVIPASKFGVSKTKATSKHIKSTRK